MSKYPLCEELGLTPSIHEGPGFEWVVSAADLERLLSQAPVMFGAPNKDGQWSPYQRDETKHLAVSSNFINDTHTARLIGVKPIKKDTAESLLSELTALCERMGLESNVVIRAKKLLEGK